MYVRFKAPTTDQAKLMSMEERSYLRVPRNGTAAHMTYWKFDNDDNEWQNIGGAQVDAWNRHRMDDPSSVKHKVNNCI
jgi:hypothetical protein